MIIANSSDNIVMYHVSIIAIDRSPIVYNETGNMNTNNTV